MKIFKKNDGERTKFREIGNARHLFSKLSGPSVEPRVQVTMVEWPHGGEYFNLEMSLDEAVKLRFELNKTLENARSLGFSCKLHCGTCGRSPEEGHALGCDPRLR